MTSLIQFIENLTTKPESIDFTDTMAIINEHYDYQATTFYNGELLNDAGTNEGSCKIFAFALMNDLDEQYVPHLFGNYYREDVLKQPNGKDHGNIRNFLQQGTKGLCFHGNALTVK
jgi:hypothetical protein